MEALKNLLSRFSSMGVVIFIGFLVFVYGGLAVVYLQQDGVQANLETQNRSTELIVGRELSDPTPIEDEYHRIKGLLQPMSRDDAIDALVNIAEAYKIDITPSAGKLIISPNSISVKVEEVGSGSYQVMSFSNITVRSLHENILDLIRDLDEGTTNQLIVLTSVDIKSPNGTVANDGATEHNAVQLAVRAMMKANGLLTDGIPNPLDFEVGIFSNDMTRFPDVSSEWYGSPGGKIFDTEGGTYKDGDAPGFVLYNHDNRGDGTTDNLVDYLGTSMTKWYYTCEADGTVRQFAARDPDSEMFPSDFEVDAVLSVNIYSLEPVEEEAE